MKIKLVDSNFGKQQGLCPHIISKNCFSKKLKDPDLVIFTDQECYRQEVGKYNCKKAAWLIEPPIVNGENYINMVKNYAKFDYVFSYNRWLENKIPNFHFIAHGGCWLRLEDIHMHKKNKLCSIIMSEKQWNAGHRQRHSIYQHIKNDGVDGYGKCCGNPVENKIDSLKDYMFSLAMENEAPPFLFYKSTDYFSEKVLDCFLTGTIPVYLGNPTIKNYFNKDGILIFSNHEEAKKQMQSLSKELYLSKLDAVKENFQIAKQYIHPEESIINFLEKT
tara:strand:- start:90 stop:917 length:828 start_codon:yes stop_codon:yes gene_type:complete